jgi:hypothetical protein
VLAVVAAHLLVARWWPGGRLHDGLTSPLVRMEVAFVRELQPAAPPTPASGPARPAPARRPTAVLRSPPAPEAAPATQDDDPPAAPVAEAADASEPAEAAEPAGAAQEMPPAPSPAPAGEAMSADGTPDPLLSAVAAPPEPPDGASGAAATAQAADPGAPAGVSAAAGPGDAGAPGAEADVGPEWPLSTRLDYVLTGHYRGPVDGQARVEWLRQGARYQVHLELSVGPFFAPLASRRLSSEGRIGPNGLHPERYEEETRVAFRQPRRWRIELGPAWLRLPGGRDLPRLPGVQDSASQFVHMTWLFTTQPERLVAGHQITLPLALPRSVEPWTYEVLGEDRLHTPVGVWPVVHVRPRREARPGGDLVAEFWVAPTLQYLPVRILIRQSEETWIDLQLSRLPLQAGPAARGETPAAAPPR